MLVRAGVCVFGLIAVLALPAPARADPPVCAAQAPGEQTDPFANQFKVGVEKRVAVCTGSGIDLVEERTRPGKGSLRFARTAPDAFAVYYTASAIGEDVFGFRARNPDGFSEDFPGAASNTTPEPPVCTGGGGAFSDQASGTSTNTLTVGQVYFAPQYCFDPNNQDRVTITVTRAPALGSVEVPKLSDGSDSSDVLYTPTENGNDSFSIRATDVDGSSAEVSAASTNVGAPPPTVTPPPTDPAPSPPALVAPPPSARTSPPVAAPIVFGLRKVPSSLRVDRKGNVTVSITGRAGTRGTATLVADGVTASARKKRPLTLGKRAFRVPASGTAKVGIHLSAKAVRAVRARKALRATLTVTGGAKAVRKRVRVRPLANLRLRERSIAHSVAR